MKNKFLKFGLIAIGVSAMGYGTWRISEYFMGITRLKYATYKKTEFTEPPISSEEIDQ